MLADLTKFVLEVLKLAPRYLIALGIFAALLLFGSEGVLTHLGVYNFAQNNRQWLGIVFIATVILFLVDRCVAAMHWRKNRVALAKSKEGQLERLLALTENEKQILRFYINHQTKTNSLRIGDGVVQGLVACGVIWRAANTGTLLGGFAFNITEFSWKYLNENKWVLDGTTLEERTDAESWLQ